MNNKLKKSEEAKSIYQAIDFLMHGSAENFEENLFNELRDQYVQGIAACTEALKSNLDFLLLEEAEASEVIGGVVRAFEASAQKALNQRYQRMTGMGKLAEFLGRSSVRR